MRCKRPNTIAQSDYFRSTVFIIAWPALREFVARGGRIRILCSQVLSADDIEAIDAGYTARVDETIAARIHDEVDMLLKDETMAEPAQGAGRARRDRSHRFQDSHSPPHARATLRRASSTTSSASCTTPKAQSLSLRAR